MSPYLFLFCVAGLSNALDAAVKQGQISGSRVSSTALEISHLLFADDSFLFFKALTEEVNVVKTILQAYVDRSGQPINFQKFWIFSAQR